jgi:DNA polymerase III delta subunit
MFSEKKVCLIYNIDSLTGKRNVELLNELITDLPDSSLLFLMTAENRAPHFISAEAQKKVRTVQFWRYFENDLMHYIINSFKKNGIQIDREAAGLLIALLGSDVRKIDGAVERILYSGEKMITPVIVENFVQFEKDVTVFDFIDTLFKKDKNAVNLLAKITESGVYELSILSLIFRQAELIEKYYGLLKAGMTREEAAHNAGIYPKYRANFLEYTRKFSPYDVKNIFPLIYRADYRIKSASYSKSLIENPLFELVSEIII